MTIFGYLDGHAKEATWSTPNVRLKIQVFSVVIVALM
jgi:hypothetical protein